MNTIPYSPGASLCRKNFKKQRSCFFYAHLLSWKPVSGEKSIQKVYRIKDNRNNLSHHERTGEVFSYSVFSFVFSKGTVLHPRLASRCGTHFVQTGPREMPDAERCSQRKR